jgi:hypothetical protein
MIAALRYKLMSITRDRTVVTLVTTMCFVVTIASIRPQTTVNKGLQYSAVLAMQAKWRHCANVIAGGDSRAMAAVCPSEMRKVMGELKILNYGFRAAGFSDTYCQWLERVLIPDAQRKVIILCITPLSLTEGACRVNGFTDYVLNTTQSKQKSDAMDELLSPFAPFSIDDIRRIISRSEINLLQTERFSDGWAAIDIKYQDINVGLRQYRDTFSPEDCGPVSALVVKGFLRYVRQWKEKGIEVYGFRPTTCREMEVLENSKAKFDETAFVKEFESAGGIWFSFDRYAFSTADGSHLLREFSVQLSRELARKIVVANGR